MKVAADWELRGAELQTLSDELSVSGNTLLIVYDALDTVANSWANRRLLTEALLEVVWSTRGYPHICPKLFLRPDQIDDNSLRFVELPKFRAGAIRLKWSRTDLYGLFFARLALVNDADAQADVEAILLEQKFGLPTRDEILERRWLPSFSEYAQRSLMEKLAGPFMAAGTYGYKKGRTYDWPLAHLADAFSEVTPRSFLGLMIGAAQASSENSTLVVTPEAIRHGLRAASQTRVDRICSSPGFARA